MANFSGADMRCPKCNKYMPDRCICNGPYIEERRASPAAVPEGALPPLPELSDAVIAGIMGWRGPGAYTATTLRKIREVIRAAVEADRARQHQSGHMPPFAAPAILLNADELAALRRFDECAQDGEGYDVPKEMMQRLAEIGVVRRKSGVYYEHTAFGLAVLATRCRAEGGDGAPEAVLADRAQQGEPVKPYAYEYGKSNGDGTYSVVIERGDVVRTGERSYEYVPPARAVKDWPVVPLYRAATKAATPDAPVVRPLDEAKLRELAEFWSGKYHSALPIIRSGHQAAWNALVAYVKGAAPISTTPTSGEVEGCAKCGSTGIHACPGHPIQAWTQEKIEEFNRVLSEYESEAAPSHPSEVHTCTCPSGDGSLRWPCPVHPSEAKAGEDA